MTVVGLRPVSVVVAWAEWARLLAHGHRGDDSGVSLVDVAQIGTAAIGLLVAGLVAFMPYARRPRLIIEEDEDRNNSRVEASRWGGLPHVRLLVSNARGRRAAKGTRVLLQEYTVQGSHQAAPTTVGHPSLEWPSTREDEARTGAVTVFAGAQRPITLGYFFRAWEDDEDVLHYVSEHEYRPGEAQAWYLKLTIGLDINDNRDKLPPEDDGYAINRLVGAEDGAARSFRVSINWDGNPDLSPEEVLASALEHLAVQRASRRTPPPSAG
jgi:hypothetical protein